MPDMYLLIDGVVGECESDAAPGGMDLNGWDFGVTNSGTNHVGSGGSENEASWGDITISRKIDKASPTLMKLCASGAQKATAEIKMFKSGDGLRHFATIKMSQVIVTSYSIGGSNGSEALSENIELNFANFEYWYKPQSNDDQSLGAPEECKWDIRGKRPK